MCVSIGVAVGLILNYAYPPNDTHVFDLACAGDCNSSCANTRQFEVGEDIRLRSWNDELMNAEVLSKVFKDKEGNYIEQTVSDSSCLYMYMYMQ